MEPGTYSHIAYPVSNRLSTLLRHGDQPRKEDGAIEFWRLKDRLRYEFENSRHWSDEVWESRMAGGGNKKRFQCCSDSSGQEVLYLRALQGHSGRNLIHPSLQDNVLIPDNFFEYIYRSGCVLNLHSITNSGKIVFFSTVNLMNKEHKDPHELDLTKPRLASYKQKTWKRHQDTMYWVDIQLAQRKGLKFYQTRSNAIILDDTLPAFCIPKVVAMESGEIINEKVFVSPRPPPKISFKDNWMKELDSEAAGSSKVTQRIQPKPKTQLSRTVRPVGEQPFTQEVEKDVLFGREGTKNSTRTARPVDGPQSIQSCVPVSVELVDKYDDKDENVDADQTRTVRPVGGQPFTQLEEVDIDFRVPRLSHAVVKEAENFSVQELVKKIESHPHREALHADLQQNNIHNSFSNNSKEMIREMGNVELFGLCETTPKVHCPQCVLYWNQGMIYCTCGQFSVESEPRRKFNKLRLDALSIPHYVIKKRRPHGARHGRTEEQKEYLVAFNAWKRCCKKVDSQGGHFTGIHDRFPRDQVYRESQLKIDWTEQKCIVMDKLAQEKSHVPSL